MEYMDLVSIICPVYNAKEYLNCCLESLTGQTYRNIEIILVDDGSRDASPDICDEWALRDKRIRVFHKKQGGVSSARNIGVKEAKGKYLVFVDADDVLELNALEILLSNHDREISTIVALNYDRFSDTPVRPAEKTQRGPRVKNYANPDFSDLVSVRSGCYVWGVLVPKRLIDAIKLDFNEEMHNLEDVAWMGILMFYIQRLVFVEDILYHYRRNPTSITSNCTNVAWQAKCWLRAETTIYDYFSKKSGTIGHRRYMRKMSRHCKNNFYAECFAGAWAWKRVRDIKEGMETRCRISIIEFALYNLAFRFRRIFRTCNSIGEK